MFLLCEQMASSKWEEASAMVASSWVFGLLFKKKTFQVIRVMMKYISFFLFQLEQNRVCIRVRVGILKIYTIFFIITNSDINLRWKSTVMVLWNNGCTYWCTPGPHQILIVRVANLPSWNYIIIFFKKVLILYVRASLGNKCQFKYVSNEKILSSVAWSPLSCSMGSCFVRTVNKCFLITVLIRFMVS